MNPEGYMVEAEDENLRMLSRRLPEGSLWMDRGVKAVEVLEYREEGDEEGLRVVRITRPAGTWTVGALAEAAQLVQTILEGRADLPEPEDEE